MSMVDQIADDLVEEVGVSTEDLKPGTRLGRYELLLAIAKGGMARVWAARQHGQRGFPKLVAIKTILPHLAEEPEFERMFLDEARIAAGVHHPNVCEIYELGEEGRVLYLAMEWVNGESLVRVLRSSGKTAPIEPRLVRAHHRRRVRRAPRRARAHRRRRSRRSASCTATSPRTTSSSAPTAT